MGVFSDVTLVWKGQEFKVPATSVLELNARIEDVVTFDELMGRTLKRVKIAQAYGTALRFAGAEVKDEEVYTTLFGQDAMISTLRTLDGLLKLMIPPEHLRPKAKAPAKEQPTDGKKPRSKASKNSLPSA